MTPPASSCSGKAQGRAGHLHKHKGAACAAAHTRPHIPATQQPSCCCATMYVCSCTVQSCRTFVLRARRLRVLQSTDVLSAPQW